ncbi:lymphatic vessel endothelial hyaluronic acid receptor 1a [Hypanus sabinus]|uniref:lymphatic vessel endothelial hyaluronic acid receptor 1a n=1 Tax=Hypanus sabinus TaxID=79690 RepID=UPI0028C4B0EF|nr:lymphatic vessel endothelial hyaluronic acid receptor 1a [Hypanus sabinus]
MAGWALISAIALSQALTVHPQAPLNVQDFSYSDCRTAGVFYLHLGHGYNLNLTQARSACQLFDTVLATEAQVQQAWSQGFETCRYGWVEEGYPVIPRITPKEPCGKNRTGVVTWKQDHTFLFDAYCFRENDSKRVNACEPLEIRPTPFVTELSSVDPDMRTVPAFSSETMPHLDTRVTTLPQDSRTTMPTLTQVSMSTQVNGVTDPKGNRMFLGNRIIYCVLVVVFVLLLALVIILICFLKKRRRYSYSGTRQPKENIETEVWSLNPNGTSSS